MKSEESIRNFGLRILAKGERRAVPSIPLLPFPLLIGSYAGGGGGGAGLDEALGSAFSSSLL
jgi:hypothetical protein